MKTIKAIQVSALFSNDLKSRLVARNIRNFILEKQYISVTIDFKNVTFASRTFMDEFYNQVVLNPKFKTKIINMSSDIQSMFDAVKATQHKSREYKNESNHVFTFSSVSDVNNYLNGLSFL